MRGKLLVYMPAACRSFAAVLHDLTGRQESNPKAWGDAGHGFRCLVSGYLWIGAGSSDWFEALRSVGWKIAERHRTLLNAPQGVGKRRKA